MAHLLLEHCSTVVTLNPGMKDAHSAPPSLSGSEMNEIGVLRNVSVLIRDDQIAWIGNDLAQLPVNDAELRRIDGRNKTLLPGFVDSHTHLVFAGNRSNEFAMRLRGATYQEIAEAGGGILSSMRSVREASLEEIVETSRPFVRNAFNHGSTTIEVKSGYGLSLESELKLLKAISILNDEEQPDLVPTFLGAHAFPPEYGNKHDDYVTEIISTMLPVVVEQGLAEYCDVFTDTGYFTVEQSERIFSAAKDLGLKTRVHADELSDVSAASMAARVGATSADHLLMISERGIADMKREGVIATLLPGTAFYLGLPYAPARTLIESGLTVALATDCNPGSNMSENMQVTLALACMRMKMTIEEAITASTLNGAAALHRSETIGSIAVGKKADLILCNVVDFPDLVYHYGVNHVEVVIKNGEAYSVSSSSAI